MDPIRKIVASRLKVRVAGAHPDAEALSAFTESALPERERAQVLAHLAECSDCRQIVFFALPDSLEAQRLLSIKSRTSQRFAARFALGWGTLAAAIAVGAVLFVGTRHRASGPVSLYKQAIPAKAPGQIAAELKTPADVAEMHALRDDRVMNRTGAVREEDKLIPTPKHMTAKPSGKFDFDETGQVRMAPRSETAEMNKLQAQGGAIGGLTKLEGTPAPPVPAAVPQSVGAPMPAQNTLQNYTTSGQFQGGAAQFTKAKGNLSGAVLDPSGAVIRNAAVTMNGPVGSQTALSDATGQFAFQQVTSGSYAITAQAPGFKTAEVQQVAILDNKDANLRLTLEPANTSESVEVTAAAPVQSSTSANDLAPAEVASKPMTPAASTATSVIAQNEKETRQVRAKKVVAASPALVSATLSSTPQWTLSADGTVERSIDSGKTWQTVRVGKGGFLSLCAVGSHVWAGGKAGVLYHSADSGQSWVRVIPTVAGRELGSDVRQVNFSDPINGEVDTINSEAWVTADGGQSWRLK